jgi:hypothetical protein
VLCAKNIGCMANNKTEKKAENQLFVHLKTIKYILSKSEIEIRNGNKCALNKLYPNILIQLDAKK